MAKAHDLTELPSVNQDTVPWEVTRFGSTKTKTLSFRDGLRFSIDHFDAGSTTFPHQHGFRQLRYVLDGEFVVNGRSYGPGELIDFPALRSYEVTSPTGGNWVVVQTVDTQTGEGPTSATGHGYGPEEDN
jgi:hypothetical protein